MSDTPTFHLPEAYAKKFPKLIEACNSDADIIIANDPQVLGDNYEELCMSLRLIYGCNKKLMIATTRLNSPEKQ